MRFKLTAFGGTFLTILPIFAIITNSYTIKIPFEENWLVTLDPNIPTYEALGSALTEERYLRHRREQYTDATETDPNNASVYLRKLASVGVSQYHIGAYEDALETLTTVEKLRRETSPPEVALTAMALHQVGRKQEAQATLDRLRRLFEDGEKHHAEKHLHEIEQLLAGKNVTIRRIWEYIETGQLKEACELAEKLRRLSPKPDTELARCVQSVVRALARAYYRRGRRANDGSYAETIANYEAAVLINPNFARAYADLAWLRAAYPKADFHNGPEAIKSVTKACKLTGWNDYRYISTLADVHARLGDFDSAVKWQQKAIDLLPEDRSQVPKASYEEQLELYKSNRPLTKAILAVFQRAEWWPGGSLMRTSVTPPLILQVMVMMVSLWETQSGSRRAAKSAGRWTATVIATISRLAMNRTLTSATRSLSRHGQTSLRFL